MSVYLCKQLTVPHVTAPKVTKISTNWPQVYCEVFILGADLPYVSSRVSNYLNKNLGGGGLQSKGINRKKENMGAIWNMMRESIKWTRIGDKHWHV